MFESHTCTSCALSTASCPFCLFCPFCSFFPYCPFCSSCACACLPEPKDSGRLQTSTYVESLLEQVFLPLFEVMNILPVEEQAVLLHWHTNLVCSGYRKAITANTRSYRYVRMYVCMCTSHTFGHSWNMCIWLSIRDACMCVQYAALSSLCSYS